MNGRAPNWPATGSQVEVRQKLKPNFSNDSADSRVSSTPMAMTMSSNAAANAPMLKRNPGSVERTEALKHIQRQFRACFCVVKSVLRAALLCGALGRGEGLRGAPGGRQAGRGGF